MRLLDLDKLDLDELHLEAVAAGRRYAGCEYHLIRCLASVERRGVHRRMGCGSAVQYAIQHLQLQPLKASEMLRVGRVLRERRLVERAYREGRICWSKVREITRVATAENEEFLVEFALSHGTAQVESLVACSPARWRKGQAAAAASTAVAHGTGGQPGVEPAAGGGAGSSPAVPARELPLFQDEAPPAAEALATTRGNEGRGADVSGGATAAPAAAGPAASSPVAAPAEGPPPFVPQILFKRYLKPEELALVEQAENRVRARLGGRPARGAVLAEMARMVLSAGDSRTRVRYQVYLHVDGVTGQGWLDTDRGLLPAPPEVVAEALRQGNVEQVAAERSGTAGRLGASRWNLQRFSCRVGSGSEGAPQRPGPQGDPGDGPSARKVGGDLEGGDPSPVPEAETAVGQGSASDGSSTWKVPAQTPTNTPPESGSSPRPSRRPGRRHRKAIPAATLRKLYVRARGRCEDCGRRAALDSDHLDVYSEHGTHDPERMRLRCRACHGLRHEQDFETRPDWSRAREQARRERGDRATGQRAGPE